MKTQYKNNKGFAVLEILLLIVTLSFVVAIFGVIKHHHKSPKLAQKKEASNSIKITEWNIYLQLPDTTFKTTYKPDSTDPDTVLLSNSALDKLAAEHAECNMANQFIRIGRSKSAPAQTPNKQLGGYYYYNDARPTVSPCIGTDIGLMQALSNQAYDLYDKLPSYQNIALNP
jgi:hypothetical protein